MRTIKIFLLLSLFLVMTGLSASAQTKKKTTTTQKKTTTVQKKSGGTDSKKTTTTPPAPAIVYNPVLAGGEKSSTDGKGEIYKSTDGGGTWKSVFQDFKSPVRSVTFGNGKWVAITDEKVITSSTGDEDSWEEVNIKSLLYASPRAIAAGGGFYVAVGDKGLVVYSKDGKKWLGVNNIGGMDLGTLNFFNVKYYNDKFYVVGNMNLIFNLVPAGDKLNVDNVLKNSENPGDYLQCLFNSTKIYACRKAFFRSADGKAFNQYAPTPPITIQAAAFGNGMYVAANVGGGIFSSSDAIKWEIVAGMGTGVNAPQFRDFVYVGDSFIGVGDKGHVWTSKDAKNWKKRSTDDLIQMKFLSVVTNQ